MAADEAAIFMDAVHPTHAMRPVGCWASRDVAVAIEPGSGRDRLTIHGAIHLQTDPTVMKHFLTIERLWGLMHRHITHNRCYASFKDSACYHRPK
jgi:hypothetical protein